MELVESVVTFLGGSFMKKTLNKIVFAGAMLTASFFTQAHAATTAEKFLGDLKALELEKIIEAKASTAAMTAAANTLVTQYGQLNKERQQIKDLCAELLKFKFAYAAVVYLLKENITGILGIDITIDGSTKKASALTFKDAFTVKAETITELVNALFKTVVFKLDDKDVTMGTELNANLTETVTTLTNARATIQTVYKNIVVIKTAFKDDNTLTLKAFPALDDNSLVDFTTFIDQVIKKIETDLVNNINAKIGEGMKKLTDENKKKSSQPWGTSIKDATKNGLGKVTSVLKGIFAS